MGLFKGWGASVLGIIPYASIDLAVFNTLRDLYVEQYSTDPTTMTLLGCGAFSGICGQLVSYPLARVRTLLQV
jgi:solute carrier family 25 phosphate transporter 23/24/25/41